MIINGIDAGSPSNPWMHPVAGQVMGAAVVERSTTIVWPRAAQTTKHMVAFYVKQWQALGGNAANTIAGMECLLKQLEELSANPELQPVYIQWAATADPAASYNTTDRHDGWYLIENFEADRKNYIVTGRVACKMSVALVANWSPGGYYTQIALGYSGGIFSSNYSSASSAQLLVAQPVGGQAVGWQSRAAADGSISILQQGAASTPNPQPLAISSGTISNWFLGGVRLYDTMGAGANPPPNNAATDSHWVEVFGVDHGWTGDAFFTNGLIGFLVQHPAAGATSVAMYVWSTSSSTVGWLKWGSLSTFDGGSNAMNVYGLPRIRRLGMEQGTIEVQCQGTANQWSKIRINLRRGQRSAKISYSPLDYTPGVGGLVIIGLGGAMLAWDSLLTVDATLTAERTYTSVATNYGYGAAIYRTSPSARPWFFGFLYANQPSSDLYLTSVNYHANDSGLPATGNWRDYGVFCVPLGTSGSGIVNLLQNNAHTTLGAPWATVTSQADSSDASASEATSGTTATGALGMAPGVTLPYGNYSLRVRIKATSNASSTAQIKFAMGTANATYAPNALTASNTYQWLTVGTFSADGVSVYQASVQLTATTNTDWFIDESLCAPIVSGTGTQDFPQDIWNGFMYDVDTRWTRA